MYGIYIHIPFCMKKCNYCDFASYPDKIEYQDLYVDALIDHMKKRNGLDADTVYIGGGTPTVLSNDNLIKLLEFINRNFNLSSDTEFTIEINPKTVNKEKTLIFKEYGINRISIGSQSFADDELIKIGRIHTADDTVRTFELLRDSGFSNISLDLMYALPGQTMDSLGTSLDKLLKLNPEHISCYGLKYEEGTAFYQMLKKGLLKESTEEEFADMYNLICARLKNSGYTHYEISNFCKKDRESRHNLKYWNLCDYVGFGLSASSCESLRRYTYTDDFANYIEHAELSEDYTVDKEESMSEFVILGLRVLNEGVDKEKFFKRYGIDFDEHFKDALIKVNDHVINTEKALKLKPESALVSNSIMCEFIK